jgi:hypothetical protein
MSADIATIMVDETAGMESAAQQRREHLVLSSLRPREKTAA